VSALAVAGRSDPQARFRQSHRLACSSPRAGRGTAQAST
jgi:hypothetical protein